MHLFTILTKKMDFKTATDENITICKSAPLQIGVK